MQPNLNAALYKYIYRKPLWVDKPKVLQLELHNYCNLKCQYCNVKGFHGGVQGVTTRETVKQAMTQAKGVVQARLFLNNEPLLTLRNEEVPLTEALHMAKQILKCKTVIYTNGTVSKNKDMLINRNLDEVHFTVSACSHGTYRKVHGDALFSEVLDSYFHVLSNKRSNQQIYVHFVMTASNIAELEGWRRLFKDSVQIVSMLHDGLGQDASKECLRNLPNTHASEQSTFKGCMAPDMPCTCWDNLSISFNGYMLQCCDAPYTFNYGVVGEVPLKSAWQQRVHNQMDNLACQACNLKNKRWKTILNKYLN